MSEYIGNLSKGSNKNPLSTKTRQVSWTSLGSHRKQRKKKEKDGGKGPVLKRDEDQFLLSLPLFVYDPVHHHYFRSTGRPVVYGFYDYVIHVHKEDLFCFALA